MVRGFIVDMKKGWKIVLFVIINWCMLEIECECVCNENILIDYF